VLKVRLAAKKVGVAGKFTCMHDSKDVLAGLPASRWDAEDDEEEAEVKPAKSRWGEDEHGESTELNEEARPGQAIEELDTIREDTVNVEVADAAGQGEADDVIADQADTNMETDDKRVSRKRNMLTGCRSKNEFEHLRDIGQGTYGAVSKCVLCRSGCCASCICSQPWPSPVLSATNKFEQSVMGLAGTETERRTR
jgi:hypothetical protein